MGTRKGISLTSKLTVPSGSHILYFHTSQEMYLQNAASFIRKGIELEQIVLFIDTPEICDSVRRVLEKDISPRVLDLFLYPIDRNMFYRTYEDFHFERILENLDDLVVPHVRNQSDLRLWGHVDWKDGQDVLKGLREYECKADLALNEAGYLTVCAYDGNRVPAAIQNELLKTHEYLMTDDALVVSSLYRHRLHRDTTFPTLSAQAELESEMDLYKQKLDFVHVVSHEVRNPLTVIKAYARLVSDNVESPRDRERLKAIIDYVDLIDNEISHIINTEEMLSSEALWRRRLVLPRMLLEEVMAMMQIKARTQNIELSYELVLDGKETLLANATGFKLIISNLVSNAIKYSHEGGRVQCRVEARNQRLHVFVRDEGVGMTSEQVSRLFRKYEKMNEERGGQGIGLFMVKKLVDHFEGEIEVVSSPGVGTKVQVSFPLRSAKVEATV
ncbi:ATP-binding protein [Paenibacillus sp.]|uniref:ATP-binding protein n=1 Tax=Paenibacillus sp. TaxID=58172 RepID=UPI002D758E64|nr:ATP-binding protein [Paenibacillus sp.]HZG84187.1 ATP-binding protein [Paenibacillus sp.]